MLVLSRQPGESIELLIFADDARTMLLDRATISVNAIKGNTIKLGFTAPPNIEIRRSELEPRGKAA
jgi:carbon storage regulator CsrA